jgi:hypothetical protein
MLHAAKYLPQDMVAGSQKRTCGFYFAAGVKEVRIAKAAD